jgi:hypothetical protein
MRPLENLVQISSRLPDFSHPATVDELRKIVNKAYGGKVRVMKLSDGYGVFTPEDGGAERCVSIARLAPLGEVEALVLALELAS